MGKWLQLHQHARGVRAFKAGMVPLVMGLMLSAGWLLQTASNPEMDWRLLLVCALSMLLVLNTRVHLLWLMLGGAVTRRNLWVCDMCSVQLRHERWFMLNEPPPLDE
jgi:chromate transporter